jgi:hypothetical protein
MSIDIEQALTAKLINTAAISTLVSTRCHPLRLPDTAALPAIVYTEVSAPTYATHDESSSNALTRARYQIDAWATTYAGAVALGLAIWTALEGFSGIVTSGADTFTIQSCLRSDKRTNNDAETALYWVSQDFILFYNGG